MAGAGSSESLTMALYMDTTRPTTQLRRLREQVENGLGLDGKGDRTHHLPSEIALPSAKDRHEKLGIKAITH